MNRISLDSHEQTIDVLPKNVQTVCSLFGRMLSVVHVCEKYLYKTWRCVAIQAVFRRIQVCRTASAVQPFMTAVQVFSSMALQNDRRRFGFVAQSGRGAWLFGDAANRR
jgi:hypothetical protein